MCKPDKGWNLPLWGLAGAVFAFASFGGAADAADFEIHSAFPRGVAFISDSEERIASLIQEHTHGRLSVRMYNAGEVIAGGDVLTAVQSGKVAAGFGWIGYWAEKVPVAELLGAMPFGPSPATAVSWMYGGDGLTLLQDAFRPQGVQILPCHIVASEAGGWFRKELRSPDDFKGLRMRISGLGGEVLQKMGAMTSAQPLDQMYPAMAQGKLDAAEFSVPMADMSIGFETFAKNYYFPGWHQPSSWNALIINARVWQGLEDMDRKGIETACRLNTLWTLTAQTGSQVAAVEQIRALGVSVRRFPDSVLLALARTSRDLLEEKSKRDPAYGRIYRSLITFMEQEQSWEDLQTLPRRVPRP
ncbi:TRAP transporter substrate-binding protein [Novispirillum itersonii]|uniref:TRAP-type mannitol/chloroaromatic compound transport system substrate-binding protein n=1 Tax=Novispirillum itersonii TaxID=189 RepID=A0A7X0DNW4_NOVIT|nr:TRAP transporter substrate-binding protein [Novispirillum itersonii]MBB6210617.1 TRAP-type mannitol/chloroaromatic compound transport system substrate-binding protein [Novispirillum itersonii]